MLNEPRGGVFLHVNLLVPPINSEAQIGWIIMVSEDTPPMSGSNAICVTTGRLDSGIIPMTEPVTEMVLEAPSGLVRVRAECRNGKAERITVRNLPSFAGEMAVPLDVPGIGQITVDTAFGGDSFVVVDAATLGFDVVASEAKALADLGVAITNATNAQLVFRHPTNSDWRHFSFCLRAGPITREGSHLITSAAVAIRPAKIDRSPTGTATSARMALRHARGEMQMGETYSARSILNSEFHGRIAETTTVGIRPRSSPKSPAARGSPAHINLPLIGRVSMVK